MFGSLRSVAGACLPRARPFFLAPIYFLAPATQATCSVYWNSNMTPRLSGHISIFGLFSLCSSLFWELRDNGVIKNLEFLRRRPRSQRLCRSWWRRRHAGYGTRRSLRRPWKLGVRIVAWSKPRMFCEESLGKIKFRAFPKRVGPRILLLESVDYFGTSEHDWVVEKNKNRNEQNCDCRVRSIRFTFGDDWNDVTCK